MEPYELEELPLPCPVCGQLTGSLKQYRYVSWCVFFLAGAVWQATIYRACPTCMRRFLWQKCLFNAIPANLVWLVGLLPWALILIGASYRPGHSRSVRRGVTPEMAAAREMAAREISWGRVCAVLCVLLFWLPVIGLATAALAYWLNRRSSGWTRWASLGGLAASGVVHVVLGVALVIDAAR